MVDSILAAARKQVVRRYRVADTQAGTHTEVDTHSHRDRHAIPDVHNCRVGYPAHGHRHDQQVQPI